MTKLTRDVEFETNHQDEYLEAAPSTKEPAAAILESLPPTSIIWVTDAKGIATFISDEESIFTGHSMVDLLESAWQESIHPDDVADFMQKWDHAIQNHQSFYFHYRKQRFDGKYIWFRSQGVPRFDKDGTFLGHHGFCIDISQQVETQSRLFASQSLLISILDSSPFLTAYADKSLTYKYVNNSYADLWGRARQEIVGHTISEITGDFFQQLVPSLDRVLQGETVYHEKKVTTDSGETKWLEITHVPEFDNENNVAGFYCFVSDVTDSREHERILQLVQNHIPAMIVLLNTEYHLRYANIEFCETLNFQESEIVGQSLKDLIGADAFHSCQEHLEAAKRGKKSSFEIALPTADGQKVSALVKLVPEFDADGVLAGICGLILNVSDLRNTQYELQRSEARFEMAMEGSSVGIIEFDSENEDWVFADHIESLLGFKPGQLKNSRRKIRDLIHPEDLNRNDLAKKATAEGEKATFEIRLRNSEDQYRWFEVFTRPTIDESKNLSRIAGTITDINALKDAQLKSIEQVRMRDEFLAMLSHELRNPLAAILLTLDCLHLDESSTHVSDFIEIIKRHSNHISKLLDDLLDVSRIIHRKIEFKKQTHNLNVLVNECIESFGPMIEGKRLQLGISEETLPVFADESRIRQLISNLVENAIKYTLENGEISISTRREDDDAVILVGDNGIGIEPEIAHRIFDMFFRAENHECRHGGGLGVGLYLVRQIVQAHEGTVVVNSQGVGKGSEFEIRIPLTKEQHADPTSISSIQNVALQFAVVEDNHDVRNVLSTLLSRSGFEVQQFENGETASQQIPTTKPDFAIIDIGLPGKNGMELARDLRNNEQLSDIKLIALTGYGQLHDRELIADAGFDLHLVKPINMETLNQAITDLRSAS